MVYRKRAPPQKDVALERIMKLSRQARMADGQEFRKRYMKLAETIAKRMDMPLPREIKRSYCKNCGQPYGKSTRIRVKRGLCLVTCSSCSDVRRLPYRN